MKEYKGKVASRMELGVRSRERHTCRGPAATEDKAHKGVDGAGSKKSDPR